MHPPRHRASVTAEACIRAARLTSEEQLDEMYSDSSETLVVRGHNQLPAARNWRGRTVVTAGSVGLPLDGSTRPNTWCSNARTEIGATFPEKRRMTWLQPWHAFGRPATHSPCPTPWIAYLAHSPAAG